MSRIALAIDIGGSKYVVGLVNEAGDILAQARFKWKELTAESVFANIVRRSRELLLANPAYVPSVIGVTIPGLADPTRGLWLEASFSGIQDFPIGEMLNTEFGIPVHIENDGQACALAEQRYGTAKSESDFLYLTVSNGIGGAIILGGTLLQGTTGHAGEFGHCVVVPNGRACKCGNLGCLEAYAAGPAITRNYLEACVNHGEEIEKLDAKQIGELARSGDAAAIATYEQEGVYLGMVIAQACNILNIPMVVIGGGVSLDFGLFSKALHRTLEAQVYRRANQNIVIKPSILKHHGGLMGAATIAFRSSFEKQAITHLTK